MAPMSDSTWEDSGRRNPSAEARILVEAVERRVDRDLEGTRFVTGRFRLRRSECSFSRYGIDIPFGQIEIVFSVGPACGGTKSLEFLTREIQRTLSGSELG
jgi:hypothetical protein